MNKLTKVKLKKRIVCLTILFNNYINFIIFIILLGLFSSLIENTNITKTDWNTSTKPSWILNTPAPIFSNEKNEENEEEHGK